MGSKQLKSVKAQNKAMKTAVKDQKAEEKQAVAEYKQAKANSTGFIKSKADRTKIKQAKLNMQREKAETKYGKQLQKQGKTLQKSVKSESKMLGGLVHSDKKITTQTRQNAQAFTKDVTQFASGTGLANSAAKKLQKMDVKAGKAVGNGASQEQNSSESKSGMSRFLPSQFEDLLNADKMAEKLNGGMGLGE